MSKPSAHARLQSFVDSLDASTSRRVERSALIFFKMASARSIRLARRNHFVHQANAISLCWHR